MNIGAKAFAARVKLPCRLFCGGERGLEVFGTAVSIDTGSAVLAILDPTRPKLGEVIDLELQLPANTASTAARCLALRARVEQVVEMRDGTRQMTVRFRKAAFKDSEKPPRKPPKAAAAKEWEM